MAARLTNPAWYSRDWSSDELTWDGDFGPGVKLYSQGYAHGQGMEIKTSNRRYVKGISDFIIAVRSLTSAFVVIERFHGR